MSVIPLDVSVPSASVLVVGLVAALPGLIALGRQTLGDWTSGQRDLAARRRIQFADALAAVVSYEEFLFVIRRRRISDRDIVKSCGSLFPGDQAASLL